MTVTNKRDHYKPFSYPEHFNYYKSQQRMHWLPEEVNLSKDVEDWQTRLSEAEKNLLTQIFRFFTQGDVDIARGYVEKYLPLYGGNPETRMMLLAFASMESVHAEAYSLLLDTVGMPETEYKAFQEYEQMVNKHEFLFSLRDPVLDLAVFSAFGEGLQLFSSFIILLNFTRFGKMNGMGQIITWSIRDESLHVEGMLSLFNTLIDENPELWTENFKARLYQICRDMVDLEDAFIDLAFEQGGIEGLEPDDVKAYIRYIADRRLLQLNLKPNYGVSKNPLPWVNSILGGDDFVNFFESKPTDYAKGYTLDQF